MILICYHYLLYEKNIIYCQIKILNYRNFVRYR